MVKSSARKKQTLLTGEKASPEPSREGNITVSVPRTGKTVMFYALLVAGLSLATFTRNDVWRSNVTIWEDVAKKSPNKARVYNNLSSAYRKSGKIDEAIKAVEIALAFEPDWSRSHNNLGLAYAAQKRYSEAMAEFKKAVFLEPGFAEAYNNLAGVYIVSGDYGNAIVELQKALQLDPGYIRAHYNIGAAYFMNGNHEEAMKEYGILQGVSPGDAGVLYTLMQRRQSGGKSSHLP